MVLGWGGASAEGFSDAGAEAGRPTLYCSVSLCKFIKTDSKRVGHTYAKKASERARQRVVSCCAVFCGVLWSRAPFQYLNTPASSPPVARPGSSSNVNEEWKNRLTFEYVMGDCEKGDKETYYKGACACIGWVLVHERLSCGEHDERKEFPKQKTRV